MKNHAGRPLVREVKERAFKDVASESVEDLMDIHTMLSKIGMKNECTHLHFAIDLLGRSMTALGESGRESEKS